MTSLRELEYLLPDHWGKRVSYKKDVWRRFVLD
jgi:hypothetical protein